MDQKANREPLISVIVPVYGTEKWLRRCLDSIIWQSYRNIELICVNDASPDGCAEILDAYIKSSPRIAVKVVTHEKNKGLFAARLSGLKVAKGDYIAFVDSDDYINLDFYRPMLKNMIDKHSDIIVANAVHEDENGYRYIHPRYADYRFEDCCNGGLFNKYFEQEGNCFIWHTVWNKVYRREILEKSLPYYEKIEKHLIMAEDFCYSTVLFFHAKTISYSEYSYYFYFQHSGASTSLAGGIKKYLKNIGDLETAFGFVEDFLGQVGVSQSIADHFVHWRELYARFWTDNVQRSCLKNSEIKKLNELLKQVFKIDKLTTTKLADNFFYGGAVKFDSRYIELSDYFCKLEKNVVVSFDLFDTMVVRPVYEPKDLFVLLDTKFADKFDCLVPFHDLRVEAEKQCRQKNVLSEEVTLQNIYDELSDLYQLDRDKLNEIYDEELNIELSYCSPRKSIKNLFDLLIYTNKHVIISSDIYLPKNFIVGLLNKNGYKGYKKIYLSSEFGVTKSSGNLYRCIINDLQIKPEQIFHIGDNWNSDVLKARSLGLQSYFYGRAIDCLLYRISDVPSTNMFKQYFGSSGSYFNFQQGIKHFSVRVSLGVIANKLFDNPFYSYKEKSLFAANPWFLGYAAVGMHLLALALWIERNSRNYDEIHFIARDGYLPMEACKLIFEEDKELHYIHASRKAFLAFTLLLEEDSAFFLKQLNAENLTPKNLCEYLEDILSDAFLLKIKRCTVFKIENLTINLEANFHSDKGLRLFVDKVIYENIDRAKARKFEDAVANFYRKQISRNSISFDIGYSGRTLLILSKLLGYPLDGLFVHSYDDENAALLTKAGIQIKNFYEFSPVIAGHIRELLLSEVSPSCIGFEFRKEIEPKFEADYLHYSAKFVLKQIQYAALQFIKDMKSIFGDLLDHFQFRNIEASLPLEYCLLNLNDDDMGLFSTIDFEDRMYMGNDNANLCEIWRRDINYHLQGGNINSISHLGPMSKNEMEAKILTGHSRWKKALFYFLFDRETFKRKLKERKNRRK